MYKAESILNFCVYSENTLWSLMYILKVYSEIHNLEGKSKIQFLVATTSTYGTAEWNGLVLVVQYLLEAQTKIKGIFYPTIKIAKKPRSHLALGPIRIVSTL